MAGEVELAPISVFVGHKYVQHAVSKWYGEHCIWYRSYLLPENHDLTDAVAFFIDASLLWCSKRPQFL